MTEPSTTTEREIPIRTLVVGNADLRSYSEAVLQEARAKCAHLDGLVAEAESGVAAASRAKEPAQLRRWRGLRTRRSGQLARAWRLLNALERGYLPIPRLPAVRLEWTERLIPPGALETLAEAKAQGLFEWFGIVDGTEADAWGFPTPMRARHRDPILVGMVAGEVFPIAWWR